MSSSTGDPVWRSSLPAAKIAILAALEIEGRIPGRIPGHQSLVYVSGPGPARASATAERAIAEGAAALLSWGMAGGLTPRAWSGRLFLPKSISSATGEWQTDEAWRQRLVAALRTEFSLLEGALVSTDRVVAAVSEKAELARQAGADAVDMESAAIARVAADAGMPFVVVRAIADSHTDALPANVEDLVTAAGRPRYRGLVPFLLSPQRLGSLIGLAKCSRMAQSELRRALRVLVASAPT